MLGVVNVDQPVDVRPFAQLLRRLEPGLRGPGFAAAFEPVQQSLGLDLVPEPLRSRVLAAQVVRSDVVLGYWDEVLHADPDDTQARVEHLLRSSRVPYLAVFGRVLAPAEREYLVAHLAGVQIEEWAGGGHFVHLVDVDRFTARLRVFIESCAPGGPRGGGRSPGAPAGRGPGPAGRGRRPGGPRERRGWPGEG